MWVCAHLKINFELYNEINEHCKKIAIGFQIHKEQMDTSHLKSHCGNTYTLNVHAE